MSTTPRWRNRIVDEGEVPAAELVPFLNPKNWREHNEDQAAAMTAVLDEVGWVQDVIFNRTTNHVVDGHLRIMKAAERGETVPVTYVELTEEEENKVLATFDPLSTLATVNQKAFDDLLATVQTDSLLLRHMLDNVGEREEAGKDLAPEEQPVPAELQMQAFEHYDYVVLLFRNSLDFDRACDLFQIARRSSPIGQGRFKIGLGRVVDGARALEQVQNAHRDPQPPA